MLCLPEGLPAHRDYSKLMDKTNFESYWSNIMADSHTCKCGIIIIICVLFLYRER